MNLVALLVVFCCMLLSICDAKPANNKNACQIIQKFKEKCYKRNNSLVFMQSTRELGNIVTFYRNETKNVLRIRCHSKNGIDLARLPVVNFNEVESIVLQQCSLSDNSVLAKIQSNFNITKLQSLDVESTLDQKFTTLSDQLFNGMNDLKDLSLTTNSYVEFDENVFKPLRNLSSLKLQVYDIISVPYNVFKPLWGLKTLLITSSGRVKNETKTLNFTLNSCINLKLFQLSEVRWPIHVLNLLSHNRRLKKVEITGNKIESLSEDVFKGSSEVEEIILSNNSIKILPAKMFSTQSDLVRLDLSHNQIEGLDDQTFEKNFDLESINLSCNRINTTSR